MSYESLAYQVVDAFTDVPFKGNPAAVCEVEPGMEAEAMQAIAAEMNLSETAFVTPIEADGMRHLRWFTPTTEVPLCGHATLATGHVLFTAGADSPLRFRTLSGELVLHREEDGRIRMDFPTDVPTPCPVPAGLAEALGVRPIETLRGRHGMVVRLESEADVRDVEPDFGGLSRISVGDGIIVLSVTAPSSEPGVDVASRVFAPWAGVDEDPVTGLAHTSLAPYWCEELGRDEVEARQVSRRGGALTLRRVGDRVHLVGRAVSVAEGTIRLP
jgi:PhzF family phenazine biosynthesis protein